MPAKVSLPWLLPSHASPVRGGASCPCLAWPSPQPERPEVRCWTPRDLPTLCRSHLGGLSQWAPPLSRLALPLDSDSHHRPPQGLMVPHCLSRPPQESIHRGRNPSSFLTEDKLFQGKECLPPPCPSAKSLAESPTDSELSTCLLSCGTKRTGS